MTIALPHDVQAEAFDYPFELFEKRCWQIQRNLPDEALIEKTVNKIKKASNPMIVAGGGAIYSGAENVIKEFSKKHGIPVTETLREKEPFITQTPSI